MKWIWGYHRFSQQFSRIYSSKLNPFYHLGSIAIFLLVVDIISGIYLFLFYQIEPAEAYNSVEGISAQFVGNIMRGIHRYSSDALIIFAGLHFLHMLITGKFRRVLSWMTGVGSIAMALILGLTGFILVWDHKAKLMGLLTSKLLMALPVFNSSIAGGFLLNDLAFLSGFFRVTLSLHVFLTLGMVVVLWIHVAKMAKPKIIPPRYWMWLAGGVLIAISLIFPVVSDPPAQESIIPYFATFDWYYFAGFYLMKVVSVPVNWAIILVVSGFLLVFPFLFRKKKKPVAIIDENVCDGCKQCWEDCPYEAIDMVEENGAEKAVIDPSLCVACGICVGSCKEMAVTLPAMPDISIGWGEQGKELAVFNCRMAGNTALPDTDNIRSLTVECIGDLSAKEVEKLMNRDVKGVLLAGCEDCFYRFGMEWEELRLNHKRRPVLSSSVDLKRIKMLKGGYNLRHEAEDLIREIAEVDREKVRELQVKTRKKRIPLVPEVLCLLFFLVIPLLSNTQLSFYEEDKRMVIINFKYNSSPVVEMATAGTGLEHMQSSVPIVKRRSPIELVVTDVSTGKILYSEVVRAGGWREDIAIYVYHELYVNGNVSVKLTETEFPDRTYSIENVEIETGDATVISFKYDNLISVQPVNLLLP